SHQINAMPRPSPPTTLGRAAPVPSAAEVSMANKTANAFLGARRPVWLTAGARQQVTFTTGATSAASAAPEAAPTTEAHEQAPPAVPLPDPKLKPGNLSNQYVSM
ncbi:hypothetical protein SEPCBS57363_002630, partial [Sporothrix epigloea]